MYLNWNIPCVEYSCTNSVWWSHAPMKGPWFWYFQELLQKGQNRTRWASFLAAFVQLSSFSLKSWSMKSSQLLTLTWAISNICRHNVSFIRISPSQIKFKLEIIRLRYHSSYMIYSLHTEAIATNLQTPSLPSPPPWVVGTNEKSLNCRHPLSYLPLLGWWAKDGAPRPHPPWLAQVPCV